GGRGLGGPRADRAAQPRRLPQQVRPRALDRHPPDRRPGDGHRPPADRPDPRRAVVGHRPARERGARTVVDSDTPRSRLCADGHRTRHAAGDVDLRSAHRAGARPGDRRGHARRGGPRPGGGVLLPRRRAADHRPIGSAPDASQGGARIAMKRLLAIVALVGAATIGPVAAETITVQTGTWFIGALAGLPAPPTLPTGGLWISGTPLGPYAMSAVRFTLPADRANPT